MNETRSRNVNKKNSRKREIDLSKKDKCYKYNIIAMSVLILTLILTHFDIAVNKTFCFRSKIGE